MNQYNFLFNDQLGFPNPHFTNLPLICLTGKIRKTLDDSDFAYGVFSDMQKLFETANHRIFLTKFEQYGVPRVPISLYKSYLEN